MAMVAAVAVVLALLTSPSKKLTPRSPRLPKNFVHRVPSTCIAIASYIRMTSTHPDLIYLTVGRKQKACGFGVMAESPPCLPSLRSSD